MAIVGLTTNEDGTARIHRTVNCKVCIGLAPDENSNYPKKLDHFAFLKMEMVGKDMKWVVDKEKQDHYGAECKSVWIILMSNEAEDVFRTELAAYVKTRCWCRGDGEKAMRREKIDGKYTGDFKIWNGPCGNHGCPDFESQNGKPAACKPSADLYFILQDFPTLGTICRIHTSSYQSIRQISSALRDLQAVTGGRLMGIACKLFVMPAKSTFTQGGVEKSGTKYVLGLELAAKDMPLLMESMAKTAGMFQGLQKQLNGATLDVEEDDDERASEIAEEFYPPAQVIEPPADPEAPLRARADELLQEFYPEMNKATRIANIGKYQGKMQQMIDKIMQNGKGMPAAQPAAEPKKEEAKATPTNTSGNVHNLTVTDDDFPAGMFDHLGPEKKAEPETKPKPEPAKNAKRGFNF